MATRLRSCEDHPSPSEFASKEMEWLRGYAVVKTTPPPRNLLVKGMKWLRGYAVVKTTPPPHNMLVRKEVSIYISGKIIYAYLKSTYTVRSSAVDEQWTKC